MKNMMAEKLMASSRCWARITSMMVCRDSEYLLSLSSRKVQSTRRLRRSI